MKKILLITLSSFLFMFSYAQTGPGGIGNSSNNILWLDADSILLADSASIAQWFDISGNGNHAIQSVPANQPILRTSSSNSHNTVSFDGTNDFMQFATHFTSDAITMYVVFNNILPTSVNRYGFTTQDHNFMTQKFGGSPGDQQTGFEYANGFYSHSQVVSKFQPLRGQVAGNGGLLTLSIRGSEVTYPTPVVLNNNTVTTLGALFNGSSYQGFHRGGIAEVVLYNTTLNVTENIILMNSLTAKYGSNMHTSAVDLYNYQNSHSYDIVGIGQTSSIAHTNSKGAGVVQVSNPNDLVDNEYLLYGHQGASLDSTSQVPPGFDARWERVWRADKTGDLGTVTLTFHVGTNGFAGLSDYYVLIDDDGNFTNGGTQEHDFGRTVDANAGTVSFDEVYLADGNYFTLASKSEDFIIETVQSGDWNEPSTWDCGCTPSFYSEATIRNNHVVTLQMNGSVKKLTIQDTAIFNLTPTTTFDIYSELIVNGEMNNNENTVNVRGSEEAVYFYNFSADTVKFYHLRMYNPFGLFVEEGDWAVQHILKHTSGSGTITNNADAFVLTSNSTKTLQNLRSVAAQPEFAGEFVMERYISPRKAAYINLASPTPTTLSDWDQEIYMSGVNGIDGNARQGHNGPIYYSVYSYDNITQTYDTITDVSEPLIPGLGYELFLGDDLLEYTPAELGVINVQGTPTTDNVTVAVNEGFNLLGNPYQAFLNWSSVSKPSGLQNQYYVFNSNTGNYQLYSFSTLIPPSQGFWVEKNPGSGGVANLTFREIDKGDNRSTNTSTFLRKKNEGDSLLFKITNDRNDFSHMHTIEFNPTSLMEEDENDISYLPSRARGVPAIFSSVTSKYSGKNRDLMLNSISTSENNVSIPLTITAGDDANYTIEINNIDEIASNYSCISLEDKIIGSKIDLTETDNYEFYANKGTYNRFELHLSKIGTENCNNSNSKSNKAFTVNKIDGEYYFIHQLENNSDYVSIKILDALGRQVNNAIESDIQGNGKIRLNTNALNGIYLIQIESKSGRRYSNKFYF